MISVKRSKLKDQDFQYSESIDSIHSQDVEDLSIHNEIQMHPWDNISPPLESERISDDKEDEEDSPIPEDENKETV